MGFIVKAVKSVVKAVVGVVSKVVGGVFGFLVGGKGAKKAKYSPTLNKQLDPEAFRKICLGKPAMPLDLRYWEVYGTNGTLYDEVLVAACHRINGFKELYFESDLAIDAAGTVQTKYVGVVSRLTNLGAPGQTALSVGGGTQWTSQATFDGCPHMALKWIPNETKLPNGIPSRYTQVVEGAYVYDPRRDSTVAGGSGPHRINDQSTWSYATLDGNSQPIGRNNALQALWYLIGWRVQNPVTGEWILVAGRGVDPQDINLASFITGANNCEVAGYYTDMVLSTEDDHVSNEEKITCGGLIGRLIDPGGLWAYYANVDDTANIAVELTDADILEGVNVTWNEYKGMADQYNQVRGKFVYPASPVLYQMFPYPMVRDATYETNLGVKRAKPQDFEQVLDNTLAQRLARLLLNMGQYQGEFQAGFNYRMLKAQAYSVVRYTSERFGFVKLFRVWRQDITTDAGISALLKEIHASIWSAGSVTAPLAPSASNPYNPAQVISATGVNVALYPVVGANGDKGDGFRVYWTLPPTNVRRTEVRYRLAGTVPWLTAGPVARDVTEVIVAPLLSGAIYEVAVRHISIHEVPGNWINPTTAPANGAGQFQLGTTGTINSAAITAAGGTAIWANVTGPGKPENNADVTGTHISSGFTGQAPIATDMNALNRLNTMENYASPDGNQNPNSLLLVNTNYYYVDAAVVRTAGVVGDPIPFFFRAGGAGGAVAVIPRQADLVPIIGPKVFIEFLMRGNNVANCVIQGYFDFRDKDGNPLAVDRIVYMPNIYPDTANVWKRVRFAVVPSAGAVYYQYVFNVNNSGNAAYKTDLGAIYYGKSERGSDITENNPKVISNDYFATAGPNLILNPYITDIVEGRINNWSGTTGAGVSRQPKAASTDPAPFFFRLTEAYANQLISRGSDMIPVGEFKKLWFYFNQRVNQNFATTPLNIAFQFWGQDKVTNAGLSSGAYYCAANNTWKQQSFPPVDIPAGAKFVQVYFSAYVWAAGTNVDIAAPLLLPDELGATLGAQVGGNLLNAAGTAVLGTSDVVTSAGIASGVTGQTAWATYSVETPTQLSTRAQLLSSTTGRVTDPRLYNTQFILGPDNVTNLTATYTVGGSNVTVNLPAHNRVIAGPSGPITLSYGAMSGVVAFSTYWTAYVDDPNLTGIASPTVTFTSNPNDLLYPGRYQVSSGVTPAAGGGGGGVGGGGGGGGGWDGCVEAGSFMPDGRFAFDYEAGDMLRVINEENWSEATEVPVVVNKLIDNADCVELESQSGIKVVISTSTPCTLKGGEIVNAVETLGCELAVEDNDGFRWEMIVQVTNVGKRAVAHISANESTYAAGSQPGRYIYTHNSYAKP